MEKHKKLIKIKSFTHKKFNLWKTLWKTLIKDSYIKLVFNIFKPVFIPVHLFVV